MSAAVMATRRTFSWARAVPQVPTLSNKATQVACSAEPVGLDEGVKVLI